VLAHPQCQALGMLQEAPDGCIPLMGVPLSFDGERPPFRTSPPALGEATDVVLKHMREQAAE
jgi:crotonobetainyl-CoA:carnitine CoA-transferase CaiB-like acyl-CoA transferase